MRELRLLRGLPGSSKSTTAERMRINEGAVVLATDDLLWECGVYCWSPERSDHYHKINQKRAAEQMRRRARLIVIDNPHLHPSSAIPYIRLANFHGYRHTVIEMSVRDPAVLATRNTHNVSFDEICMGLKVLEKYPLDVFLRELENQSATDPEVLISSGADALTSGNFDLLAEIVSNYKEWKQIGGYDAGDAEVERFSLALQQRSNTYIKKAAYRYGG